jgi:hypothetical protein
VPRSSSYCMMAVGAAQSLSKNVPIEAIEITDLDFENAITVPHPLEVCCASEDSHRHHQEVSCLEARGTEAGFGIAWKDVFWDSCGRISLQVPSM